MKKSILFLAAVAMTAGMQARVAYLVPGQTTGKSEIPVQYKTTTFEHDAYDWFNTNYVLTGKGDFISFANIPADNKTYKAIWIYIDRELNNFAVENSGNFTEARFDELFNSDIVNALSAYVKAGGNLFLCKQAVHVAHRIGRFGGVLNFDYKPSYNCGGSSEAARTFVIKSLLGAGLPADQQTDRSNHAVFAGLRTSDAYCYPLLTTEQGQLSTDNNIEVVDYLIPNPDNANEWLKAYENNNKALIDGWETYWNARALATYGHINDYCLIMAMELLPTDTYKGTVLTMGPASYQWGDNSGDGRYNVELLTDNALKYLDKTEEGPATAVENVGQATTCTKFVKDGRLVIRHGNRYFDAMGNTIK